MLWRDKYTDLALLSRLTRRGWASDRARRFARLLVRRVEDCVVLPKVAVEIVDAGLAVAGEAIGLRRMICCLLKSMLAWQVRGCRELARIGEGGWGFWFNGGKSELFILEIAGFSSVHHPHIRTTATMARSKLLTALDAQKGRDHRLEHQKKLRKAAEKRKSAKRQRVDKDGSDEEELDSDHVGVAATSKVNGKQVGALIE
jgi:hypothetical protein